MTGRIAWFGIQLPGCLKKLRLDLRGLWMFGGRMEETGREELVSRLFALLTSMLEQGAAEAVQGL